MIDFLICWQAITVHNTLLFYEGSMAMIELIADLVIEWVSLVDVPVKIVYMQQSFHIIGFSDSFRLVERLEDCACIVQKLRHLGVYFVCVYLDRRIHQVKISVKQQSPSASEFSANFDDF